MNTLIQWAIRALAGINSTQWKAVLDYVIAAEARITQGVDKKAWVLDKLNNIGIGGSLANFLAEAAVQFLKKHGGVK